MDDAKSLIENEIESSPIRQTLKHWADEVTKATNWEEIMGVKAPIDLTPIEECTVTHSSDGEVKEYNFLGLVETESGVSIIVEDPETGKKYQFTNCVPVVCHTDCPEKFSADYKYSDRGYLPGIDLPKGILIQDKEAPLGEEYR